MKFKSRRWLAAGIGVAALWLVDVSASALESDELDPAALAGATPFGWGKEDGHGMDKVKGLPGIDSVANFTGRFKAAGVDSVGNPQTVWPYAMVGNSPDEGGTTVIGAPIVAVSIQLLDASGNNRFVNGVNMFRDATQYLVPALQSPVFSFAKFPASVKPTQFNDAFMRAQFWEEADDGWHTLLKAEVRPARVLKLPFGTYRFARNSDGTLRYVLVDYSYFTNALFPPAAPDDTTIMGSLEIHGQISTKEITTLLFPDTYLYIGSVSNCCVLGYHSVDFEAGDASNGNVPRLYVMNYSSWISPGIFGGGFTDITALSHEMSEIFDDPFVSFDSIHNQTPWWLSPNGNCQNNLEVGDVIEGLVNATLPITMPNGFTYHPQNVAMLQWFTTHPKSDGYKGAFSFPDATVLPTAAVSQKVNCAP